MRIDEVRGRSSAADGVITFARADALGGVPLLRGVGFTGTYRAHVHFGYVIGVVDGGGLSLLTTKGTALARAGSILLLNPFDVHEERPVGAEGWTYRYFFPRPDALRAAAGWVAARGDPWFPEPVVHDEPLARRLRDVHLAFVAGAGRGTAALEAELADILRALLRRHAAPLPQLSNGPRGVGWVHRYLQEEALPPLPLRELARLARLSPYHLVRSFGRQVGLPPYSFYEQIRVARSCTLLNEGMPLARVAYSAGFTDQSHFTRHFAATTGVTPGKYLTMVRKAGRALGLPTALPPARATNLELE